MIILRFFKELAIYVTIVVTVVWGIPAALSYFLHTEYPIAAVTSSSMWPALSAGDLVVIEGAPKESLSVGDIIVWRHDGGFTIHRIVELNDSTLVTKGDANFPKDNPIKYDDVIGKTVTMRGKPLRIPYLGKIGSIGQGLRNIL